MKNPVGMSFVQLGLGIDHLRLDPNTKLKLFLRAGGLEFVDLVDDGLDAIREAPRIGHPVAEAGLVIQTRVFVPEPSIIKHEQLCTQLGGRLGESLEAILVKVK